MSFTKKPRPPQYTYYVEDARGVADHIYLTPAQERGFALAKPKTPRGKARR